MIGMAGTSPGRARPGRDFESEHARSSVGRLRRFRRNLPFADGAPLSRNEGNGSMIRKLPSGKYRLYSRKINPKTGKRRNLGTFATRVAAQRHERAVQYFKRH
jgi:hypothetical protein